MNNWAQRAERLIELCCAAPDTAHVIEAALVEAEKRVIDRLRNPDEAMVSAVRLGGDLFGVKARAVLERIAAFLEGDAA